MGGWAPGGTPQPLRDGMGRQMQKGSDLVLQVHYHPSGKTEIDQSAIGIHFVKQTPGKAVVPLTIIDRRLYLAPGVQRHTISGSYTLPYDATMVVVIPPAYAPARKGSQGHGDAPGRHRRAPGVDQGLGFQLAGPVPPGPAAEV